MSIFAAKKLIMEKNLVSVIMPTYNTGGILEDSINSILRQTYENFELIITDDHSDDKITLDILKKFSKKDKRIKVFYLEKNMGSGYARNTSIKNAQGQYIAFCDSDDLWFPDKLERQLNYMGKKGCSVTYSSYILCDQNNKEEGIVISPQKVTFNMMKRDNKIGCLTLLYDAEKNGKQYFPLLRKRQDWAMLLMLLKKSGTAFGIKAPLAFYRIRPNSLSHNKISLIKYNLNVYNKVLGYTQVKSCLYFFFIFLPCYFTKKVRVKHLSNKYMKNRVVKQ